MTNEVLKDVGSSSSYRPKMIPLQDGSATSASTPHITAVGPSSSTPENWKSPAETILLKAAGLVSGDRQKTHGDKTKNHQNIADLWNAFLAIRPDHDLPLSASDVALMMNLMKVARTQLGGHNPDDYVDGAGYMGVAGEIAERAK